jgi:hypothetical protein
MAIVKNPLLRLGCAGAFAAAIIIAPVVGISAGPGAGSRTVADPCTQANTNGSVSLQCGGAGQSVLAPGAGGIPPYGGGGCVTPYGTYQNCIVQQGLFPPASRRR